MSGIKQVLVLDELLSSITGFKKGTRAQITKGVWNYAKKNGCQDKENGRFINPDAKLAQLFKTKDKVNGFTMASFIKDHVKPL